MILAYHVSVVFSIAAFLFYGVSCIFFDAMAMEFRRFGLARYRRITGGVEVAGALGLLVGYVVDPLMAVASAGLALLMILGVAVRIRVKDPVLAMAPAVVLLLANLYIMVIAINLMP